MSVVVVEDGVVVLERHLGTIDAAGVVPASRRSRYRWWSVTKPFTAVAILQLAERGQLSLDDPASDYLPWLSEVYAESFSIRQLLGHSSGVPDVGMSILGWIHVDPRGHFNQTALIRERIRDFDSLNDAPGERGAYSNLGYMILSAIIEEVTGQAYESYVETHILGPIGMSSTSFFYEEPLGRKDAAGSHPQDFMSFVAGFVVDLDSITEVEHDGRYWFKPLYPDQTAPSGLIGSTSEMSRFMTALLEGGAPLLSEQSLEALWTPHIKISELPASVPANVEYALGWILFESDGELTAAHGGAGAWASFRSSGFSRGRVEVCSWWRTARTSTALAERTSRAWR